MRAREKKNRNHTHCIYFVKMCLCIAMSVLLSAASSNVSASLFLYNQKKKKKNVMFHYFSSHLFFFTAQQNSTCTLIFLLSYMIFPINCSLSKMNSISVGCGAIRNSIPHLIAKKRSLSMVSIAISLMVHNL